MAPLMVIEVSAAHLPRSLGGIEYSPKEKKGSDDPSPKTLKK